MIVDTSLLRRSTDGMERSDRGMTNCSLLALTLLTATTMTNLMCANCPEIAKCFSRIFMLNCAPLHMTNIIHYYYGRVIFSKQLRGYAHPF